MKKYRPIKSSLISQGFGIENTKPELLPFYQSIGLLAHNGIDLPTQLDEPIYFDCNVAGYVLNTEIDNKGGLGINIITEDKDGIFKHRYWHLKSFNVVAGQKLNTGDLLGISDNTGWSSGLHLHWDLKAMIKDENVTLKMKFSDNGYNGAIDPMPFFENIFVLDYVNSLKQQINILQQAIAIAKKLWNLLKGRT